MKVSVNTERSVFSFMIVRSETHLIEKCAIDEGNPMDKCDESASKVP